MLEGSRRWLCYKRRRPARFSSTRNRGSVGFARVHRVPRRDDERDGDKKRLRPFRPPGVLCSIGDGSSHASGKEYQKIIGFIGLLVWGHRFMMSAKFSGFLTLSPLVRAWQLVYTIKFTQPPLFCLLFHFPLPPWCGCHKWMSPYCIVCLSEI